MHGLPPFTPPPVAFIVAPKPQVVNGSKVPFVGSEHKHHADTAQKPHERRDAVSRPAGSLLGTHHLVEPAKRASVHRSRREHHPKRGSLLLKSA